MSALAPHVKELSNYVRGQTWLAPPFVLGLLSELLGREKAAAEDDRESYIPSLMCWWRHLLSIATSCVEAGGDRAFQSRRGAIPFRSAYT